MTVTLAEYKGLFAQLVTAFGGVQAAGAALGISHQRVSQLQNTLDTQNEPSLFRHVHPLEAIIKQPIVTGAMARAAAGGSITHDPLKELGDVVIAQAEVLHLERSGACPKVKHKASLRLVREATHVADSYGKGAA